MMSILEAREALALAREFLSQQAELGLSMAPLPAGSAGEGEGLEGLSRRLSDCRECGLSEGRSTVVFGSGCPHAGVMFVGEAPGAEEDRQGLPFVGKAGHQLTRMIEAIGLNRDDVYIANVVKCRPPGNRDPKPEEISACEPFLLRQIELVRPRVICALGRFAAQTLLKTTEAMGSLRGRVFDYHGVPLIPTYHPAALLRNPQWKYPTWDDLKRLRKLYDGTDL